LPAMVLGLSSGVDLSYSCYVSMFGSREIRDGH
jgi:hypothetical protein